jgi:hypothetical protein
LFNKGKLYRSFGIFLGDGEAGFFGAGLRAFWFGERGLGLFWFGLMIGARLGRLGLSWGEKTCQAERWKNLIELRWAGSKAKLFKYVQ